MLLLIHKLIYEWGNSMITKQELTDKNKEMNEKLILKDSYILNLQLEIENLKKLVKANKNIDIDYIRNLENKNKLLKNKIDFLEDEKKYLSEENEKLKDSLSWYKNKVETKNARGAGRKLKATAEQLEIIQKLKNEGLSYKNISSRVDLSVGTVYNILNLK